MMGRRKVDVPIKPKKLKLNPGVMNQESPNELGGPPDWVVVPEGTTAISILGELLPQEEEEKTSTGTSLPIPEGCFAESPQ